MGQDTSHPCLPACGARCINSSSQYYCCHPGRAGRTGAQGGAVCTCVLTVPFHRWARHGQGRGDRGPGCPGSHCGSCRWTPGLGPFLPNFLPSPGPWCAFSSSPPTLPPSPHREGAFPRTLWSHHGCGHVVAVPRLPWHSFHRAEAREVRVRLGQASGCVGTSPPPQESGRAAAACLLRTLWQPSMVRERQGSQDKTEANYLGL